MVIIDVCALKQLSRHAGRCSNSFAFQIGDSKIEKRIVAFGVRHVLSPDCLSEVTNGSQMIGSDASAPVIVNSELDVGPIIVR